MKEQFIPYDEALQLKQLGFRERCLAYYGYDELLCIKGNPYKNDYNLKSGKCSAPLWQQAFDWFRKEKKLCAEFTSWYGVDKFWKFEIFTVGNNNRINIFPVDWSANNEYHAKMGTSSTFTYEQTRQACLETLIKLVS